LKEAAKLPHSKAAPNGAALESRVAGIIAVARQRKQDSRERLLAAGLTKFCEDGYISVSVEDIASVAEVSRVTFYRHFSGKADLAIELFTRAAAAAMPSLLRIGRSEFRHRTVVADWIAALFAADRANGRLLRVFTHATIDETSFTQRAQELISELILRLGATIPAFNVHPDRSEERRKWLEAWLLLYEILDQSNHAALNSGVAADPLVIEILTDRFLDFVNSESPPDSIGHVSQRKASVQV
jgi:AcrR family transcriptional regulator